MTQALFARYLLAIALGHLIVGAFLFAPYLAEIPARGWVNATGPDNMEGAVAIWFMLFTWPLLLIVVQFWRSESKVSRPFLWLCVVGSLFGISLMPASGFWLMLILSGAGLARKRKQTASVSS